MLKFERQPQADQRRPDQRPSDLHPGPQTGDLQHEAPASRTLRPPEAAHLPARVPGGGTFRPDRAAHREAAQPVLRAGHLRQAADAQIGAERQQVQRQIDDLHAAWPGLQAPAPQTAPTLPAVFAQPAARRVPGQRPGMADYAGLYRYEMALQREGAWSDGSLNGPAVAAIQRRAAEGLLGSYRASTLPPAQRQEALAGELCGLGLWRGAVQRVVVQRLPAAEQPRVQRLLADREAQGERQAALGQLETRRGELDRQAGLPALERVQARRGGGDPLPAAVQRQLELGLNADLGAVRLHTDAEADLLSKSVGAVAFTSGQDIYFQQGRFDPASREGLGLLGHEVAHTVQQARGRVSAGLDPDAGLEREARQFGERLSGGKVGPPPSRPAPPASAAPAPALQRLAEPGAPSTRGARVAGAPVAADPEAQRAARLNRSTPRAAVQAQVRLDPRRKARDRGTVPVQVPAPKVAPPRVPLPPVKATPIKAPPVKGKAGQSGAPTAREVATPRRSPLKLPAPPSLNVAPAAFARPQLDPQKLKAARLNPGQVLRDAGKRRNQANALVGRFLKRGSARARNVQGMSGQMGAQVHAAARGASGKVQAAARRHQAALRATIAAMRTQASTQAAVARGQLQARARTALTALPKSTRAAKTRLGTAHTQALRQLDARVRTQKSEVSAAYRKGAAGYRAGGTTVGGEALAHANTRASAYLGHVTGKDDSFLEGPVTDDRWKARADAARQVGGAYQQGYVQKGAEQAEQLLSPAGGMGRDLAAIDAAATQTRTTLQTRLRTAQQKLDADEARARTQIQQAQAQLSQALQAQLQGVLAHLGQTQGTQLAAIAQAAAQQSQALDRQADQAVHSLQTSVAQLARQLDRTLNSFGAQVRGSQAPDPKALKRALAGAEAQIGRMVTGAQTRLQQGMRSVTAGLARGAAQAESGLSAAAKSSEAQARQTAQGFRQSSQALVGQALQTFTQVQQAHERSSTATDAQAQAEFEAATKGLDTLFKQARSGLDSKLAASVEALIGQLRANFSQLDAAIGEQAEKAAAQVQPRWKGWVKIALLVAVVIVVAVVAGPLVIGAVGAMAGALGAGATAAGVIGAVAGGAIVGAAAGAVTQIGNNAIDNIGLDAQHQKSLFDGVGKAALMGAVGGAVGGAGGAIGQGLGKAGWLGEGLTQKVAGVGLTGAFDLGGNVMGDLATGSSLNDALKNLTSPEAIMMYAVASGTGAAASRLPGRAGGVQNTMHAAGERFGTQMGEGIANTSGYKRAPVPTRVAPELTGQGIDGRISGYNTGRTQVELAPGAHPQDAALHDSYARQARSDTSPVSRMADRIKSLFGQGAEVKPGSARWEMGTEAAKHRDMAQWRFQEAEKLPAGSQQRNRLLQEAHDYDRLAGEYEKAALTADPRERLADATIEGRKRSYTNHDEIQPLLGKSFDRSALPDRYVVFEVEGGRKVAARLNSEGTFDLQSAVLLVRPDQTVQVNPQNRITYDYISKYQEDPAARPDLDFSREGYTLHHIIPDKVSTQNPLCVKAMELTGYSPDRMSNYQPMPMEKLFRQLDGQEVGHWSHHSNYDETVVTTELRFRQDVLEGQYGPMSTWDGGHPKIAEIRAELTKAMLNAENAIKARVESGDVPMTVEDGINGSRGRIK
ncbi:hypothetical protein DEIPH_ctg009orf0008 [Deinococcus phoenicis]|uniref:eCIS core domain-containing protein n=1 Tax=Deinococcus phoenicis TaxID=1476583 RepID=A0A016QT20_9DEIO|nr:DUF4157 domain-containing protein [Deinococcus phoenicis]EYB69270.1 hypothetical protein DEIPH_ctg009orf0008 [Deinococcus phoenicis]